MSPSDGFDLSSVTTGSDQLLARGLKAGLFEDDLPAFSHFAPGGWAAMSEAFKVSRKVASFLSPAIVQGFVAGFIASPNISRSLKRIVVTRLQQYVPDDDARALRVAGEFARTDSLKLPLGEVRRIARVAKTAGAVMRQLVLSIKELGSGEVVEVLSLLGAPYTKLADGPGAKFDQPSGVPSLETVFRHLKRPAASGSRRSSSGMDGPSKSLSRGNRRRMRAFKRSMSGEKVEQRDFAAFEPTQPASRDQRFLRWQDELSSLISTQVSIRSSSAHATGCPTHADMQTVCEPITVLSLSTNAQTIKDRLVLFAEIESVHVGFCVASPGVKTSDPMFVQVVAVVPAAQRRGIGRELLAAAASTEPERDIVFATQESNLAAHAMNARFAGELGATLERVNLGVYPDRYLGIQRGQGYRAWRVKRPR